MWWLMTNISLYAIAVNTVFREMHTCGQSYCSLLLMFGLWQVSWPGCFKLECHDVTDQRVGCIAVVNTLLMWSSMLNHTGAIEVHVQNQLWANPQYMGVHVYCVRMYGRTYVPSTSSGTIIHSAIDHRTQELLCPNNTFNNIQYISTLYIQ